MARARTRKRRGARRSRSRARNPKRRRGMRSRRRNPRSRRGRKGRRGSRRRYMNPAGVARALTAGYTPKNIVDAGVVVAGVTATGVATNQLAARLPVDFIKSGLGKAALGIGVSGGLWALLGKFMGGEKARLFFLGGLAGVVSDVVAPLIEQITTIGDYATWGQVQAARGIDGLNDFATINQVAAAPAHSVDNAMMQGISEFTGMGAWGSDFM